MKCDRAKGVRRANRGVITKLVKEVDESIGTTPLSEEGIVRLKVIHKQLEVRPMFQVNLIVKLLRCVKWKRYNVKSKKPRCLWLRSSGINVKSKKH